jgi:Flp pilus assembly protein TadD
MKPAILFISAFLSILIGCTAERNIIEGYNDFAIQAAKAGLWKEAAFRWERIVRMDPKNAKAHNNLAVAYEALGRYEEAEREYKAALELDPGNKSFQRNYIRFKRLQEMRKGERVKDEGD